MSDLAAAAAALDAPEVLVQRSAEARAKASGASVDEILAAWAGGGTAPAAAAPPAAEAPAEEAPEAPAEAPAPLAPTPAPAAPAPTAPAAATPEVAVVAVPSAPPVLEGRRERPFVVMMGAVAAMLLALLAGLVAPAAPEEGTGVRSSELAFDDAALHGRDVYRELGCAECHTQMVRPIVTDAGLGPVTLSDSNQELGSRRYGPDLSDVGARITEPGDFEAILGGAGGHPGYSGLSEEDVAGLVAYLSTSPSES